MNDQETNLSRGPIRGSGSMNEKRVKSSIPASSKKEYEQIIASLAYSIEEMVEGDNIAPEVASFRVVHREVNTGEGIFDQLSPEELLNLSRYSWLKLNKWYDEDCRLRGPDPPSEAWEVAVQSPTKLMEVEQEDEPILESFRHISVELTRQAVLHKSQTRM